MGVALAAALQWPFVDLDEEIESMQSCTIADLFFRTGELGFRQAERDALIAIGDEAAVTPCVCATGGGIVETPGCRMALREHWFVVTLSAQVDTLVARLSGEIAHRPMLAGQTDLSARLYSLLKHRQPLYSETSHIACAVDGRSVESIVRELKQRLQTAGVIDGNTE